MDGSEFDCHACGACCFANTADYVAVSGDDYQRLGVGAATQAGFSGVKCFMTMNDGRCSCLRFGDIAGFTCDVYEQRPEVCRQLEPGSPACVAERERKLETAAASSLRSSAQDD